MDLYDRFGQAVVDDGYYEVRGEGELWAWCTLCKCWSVETHVIGRKYLRKRAWVRPAVVPAQAAAVQDAPALEDVPAESVPAPPPELQQQLDDLREHVLECRSCSSRLICCGGRFRGWSSLWQCCWTS